MNLGWPAIYKFPVLKILTLVIFIRYVSLLARDGRMWLDSAFSDISISNGLASISVQADLQGTTPMMGGQLNSCHKSLLFAGWCEGGCGS